MACSVTLQSTLKQLRCPAVVLTCLVVVGSLALQTGCGGTSDMPDLGKVTGVVTLDGQPLSGAQVQFAPPTGRPSTGETDASGSYNLRFTADEPGAIVGSHTVRINTAVDGRDDPSTERVPARYNSKTELTAQVEEGKNEIDFDLQSK